MTQNPTCPRCGSPLPAATPPASCPRCLLRIGLDTDFGGSPRSKKPPPSVEEIAHEFPQLEILELLGQGGMGAVYKARQKSLDRLVALKILTVDTAADPSFAERFAREARALATLDHPNIVHVHDSGRAGEHFYLLMEYVEGIDLRHMLRAGRIAPREGLAIVVQICDALQYAHDQGVVHRDIKPENILVDRRGRVKIADFGLAKIVGRADDAFALTGTHQAMGTPHYMAPEQISHPQDVDHRADIYSLGVVLYELLTGELPLGRFVPPSKRVEVDVRIDEVVLKALERDLPLRYQHASEVRTSIDRLSTPAPVTAAASIASGGNDANKSARTPRPVWPWVLGGGCLLLAVVPFAIAAFLVWPTQSALPANAISGSGETTVVSSSGGMTSGFMLGFGSWLLIAVCASVFALVYFVRRAHKNAQPVWPWFAGAGVLVLLAFPLGFAIVRALSPVQVRETRGDPRFSYDPATGQVMIPVDSVTVQHGPFCTETDDATAIRARSDRMSELGKLARRSGLSHHEQLHLAEALLAGGFFDENADGLVALMERNELGPEAIQAIRTAMRGESPSANKLRVLDALAHEVAR